MTVVVVAATEGDALTVAFKIRDGELPPLDRSVEAARARVQAMYPEPLKDRYLIYEFPHMTPHEDPAVRVHRIR